MAANVRLRSFRRAVTVATAMALAAVSSASAGHDLANGSFEAGDLSGWAATVPAGGSAAVELGGAPGAGSYFARLKTDGPGSFTSISRSVELAPGDVLSGYALFDSNDYCPFNDVGQVRILSASSEVAAPFSRSTCQLPDFGSTAWVPWSYVATSAGSFVVEAGVTNALDSVFDSELWLDGVSVTDRSAPSLTLPANMTVEATGPAGAVVAYSVSASDLHDSSPAIVCSPSSGSTFPLGATTVACTGTDASGNSSSGSFVIEVVDTTAPVASCGPGVNAAGRPSGDPNAGFRTLAGSDAVGVASIVVTDGLFASSPLPNGAHVKLTQSPGSQGAEEPGAGVLHSHVVTAGDPWVLVTDSSGNTASAPCGDLPPSQ